VPAGPVGGKAGRNLAMFWLVVVGVPVLAILVNAVGWALNPLRDTRSAVSPPSAVPVADKGWNHRAQNGLRRLVLVLTSDVVQAG
jgi:hypothetical protein